MNRRNERDTGRRGSEQRKTDETLQPQRGHISSPLLRVGLFTCCQAKAHVPQTQRVKMSAGQDTCSRLALTRKRGPALFVVHTFSCMSNGLSMKSLQEGFASRVQHGDLFEAFFSGKASSVLSVKPIKWFLYIHQRTF